MSEKTLSVDIDEGLYKDFQLFVFNKKMEEHPKSKTTLKGSVAQAMRLFLDSQKET